LEKNLERGYDKAVSAYEIGPRVMIMQRLLGVVVLVSLGSCLRAAEPQRDKGKTFQPPKVVSAAETLYPVTCTAFGTVVLHLLVDTSGKVGRVEIIRDIPSLTEQAERSAMNWKFAPAKIDGKPVAVPVVASFTFASPPFVPWSESTQAQSHEQPSSQYEPIEVLSTAPTVFPAASAAFGTVILQVSVDASGAISQIKVVHDIPSLTEEATRSVRQWKFKPASLDGEPVTSSLVASFTFDHSLLTSPRNR